MVPCADIERRLAAVIDPLHHLESDGTAGPNFQVIIPDPSAPRELAHLRPMTVSYTVRFGPPSVPYRRPVVRRPNNASEAAVIVWLLWLYYGGERESLRLCPGAQGLYHTAGRADALEKLAKYLASNKRNPVALDAVTAGTLQRVLVLIFEDPTAGRAFGKDDAVVAAATEIVDAIPLFDRAVWLPLWGWALGGPAAKAAIRTRVFAMKSLQTILNRGGLLPAQVRAADPMAEVLRQLVVQRAPNVPANEREWYLAEAQALVGTIASANTAAAMTEADAAMPPVDAGGVRRPLEIPTWAPVGGAAAVVAGLVALAVRQRRRAHV